MINLKTGKAIDMKGVNSPDTESYHSMEQQQPLVC
jgi:hypothetical protein